ncbi:hypothetical protein [Nocardia carnea]|uniref:hypothetical protein n=1 Tax=Nocardia carnea TaxID=37328 RepID=UPI00245537BB|nr:hypothetical protein [Nocardia carnea]
MSGQQYNGGFFNHFDDPDEFWEDESPEAIVNPVHSWPRTVSVSSSGSPDAPMRPPHSVISNALFEPPQRSSLVQFEVAEDCLPINLYLASGWKSYYSPGQYGEALMGAYRYAVYQRSLEKLASGKSGSPTFPSLREMLPTLLQTTSYRQYRTLLDKLIGDYRVEVHGLGVNDLDEPAMTVAANRSWIIEISFDLEWAHRAEDATIRYDILRCADELRKLKPNLASDELLQNESDSEMASRLADHVSKLILE